MTSAGPADLLYLLSLVLLMTLPYLLVEFAASQPGEIWRPRVLMGLRIGVITVALVAAGVLAMTPQWIYMGVTPGSSAFYPVWGVLFVPLIQVPLFLGFAVALLALHAAHRRAPTPRTAVRTGILLAGLGLYVAFAAGNNLVYYAMATALFAATAQSVLFAFVFAILTCVTGYVALSTLAAANATPTFEERVRLRLISAALLVPLVVGAIEAALVWGPLPYLQTVGLWRLAGVAIIAYGIARWRIYDLPQRATKAAAMATGTTAAAATGAAAYGAVALVSTTAAVPVIAAFVVLASTFLPSVNFARRLFGVPKLGEKQDRGEALYGQRIDAYRAALEASLARGSLDEDATFLGALRERFGISLDEHRVLLHLAKSSVIIAHGRQVRDAYERLRLLGEGGAGRTWLARDRARDRLVVLKEPLGHWQQEGSAKDAVLREARLAAKVRHPNVVAVEEVVEEKNGALIVMEYMDGGNLADLVRARGTLPPEEARDLVTHILRGVEAVHAAGIVHRDLKPSNVLLASDGTAKVADFGIAISHKSASSSGKTLIMDAGATTIAGTIAYMAPEVREGHAPADRRADVYGCAAILHELLHGIPPGPNAPVVRADVVPPALSAVLARGLAEDPQARYPTARAFADDLARLTL